LDTIHLEKNGQRTTDKTIGGAGFYTALAAACAGATVSLFAPRPKPQLKRFADVDSSITWFGPEVVYEEMPFLEIVHRGGGRATLAGANWGAESHLVAEDLLPELVARSYDVLHIAALSSPKRRWEFLNAVKGSGFAGLISAGTYARAISMDKASVLEIVMQAELFLMNRSEPELLFGDSQLLPVRKDQRIFITDGENGAPVSQEGRTDRVDACKSEELDPTGAGDTLCGVVLAQFANNREVLSAVKADRCNWLPEKSNIVVRSFCLKLYLRRLPALSLVRTVTDRRIISLALLVLASCHIGKRSAGGVGFALVVARFPQVIIESSGRIVAAGCDKGIGAESFLRPHQDIGLRSARH
jgi:sugar/nucleoside kinase (ribokinase family)